MTITYRSIVLHIPPTPLGLLAERWAIEHWCNLCHQRVAPAQLIAHAQDHERAGHGDQPFQSPQTSGTIAPGQPDPTEGTTPPGIPNASTTSDLRRR
ncbi:MAG: hypothetical protein M3067_01035 [Chloroflexota bacterium]|nr:hypothetical protein [Chloroflexota bacterium]MDQ6910117.1 hypothetical protein [Actinomycetota bacterium]